MGLSCGGKRGRDVPVEQCRIMDSGLYNLLELTRWRMGSGSGSSTGVSVIQSVSFDVGESGGWVVE
ncbi:hypothetical protein D9758_013774 [Tetrapyrgos nigripes]|uniref:Uncharacterized protein n=1 Tax=Tetrapyrgos nigripes TaxID=182062 RepID=A0A8H5D4R7_9AGAR|nr:hypothetical protein D9758_013774 [Tetrapyrgos nigripes]